MTSLSRLGNIAEDVAIKAPVRLATTGNIVLVGLQIIDGLLTADGDRVLVKDQTDRSTNGIYLASTGNWTRPTDASKNTDFIDGTLVFIVAGTSNAGLMFAQTCTDDPVVLGTSLVTFADRTTVSTLNVTAASSTSVVVGTGAKTFAIAAGKNFRVNQWVIAYSASNPSNSILGQISSYAGTALAVNAIASGGAGTVSDWIIVLTNSTAAAGIMPPVGSGNVTGAASSTAGHLAIFADATGKVINDGGVAGALANLSAITATYLTASILAGGSGMINGTIVESHASNNLTIAVKTLAGTDPTVADPVLIWVRNVTAGAGDYVLRVVIAPLSITISSGSLMGFTNGAPGRLWIVAFDDAGTVRLGLINCLTINGAAISIYPLASWQIASSTADNGAGGSDLSGTFYTANGGAVTSKAYGILGYASWEAGLATAGAWNAAPTRIALCHPGMKMPGDVVQRVYSGEISTTTVINTGFSQTAITARITPASAANLVQASASTQVQTASGHVAITQISRGAIPTLIGNASYFFVNSTIGGTNLRNSALDAPRVATPVDYYIYAESDTAAGCTINLPNPGTSSMTLEEIMA